MADEKLNPTPLPDAVVPSKSGASDAPAAVPVFKSEDFLAGKKVKKEAAKVDMAARADDPILALAREPDSATTTKSKPPAPQIIKRGGVSFFTALAMSTLATAGGAYLALFVQARPDVLQQVGVGGFLPKVTSAPVGSLGRANSDALVSRIAAVETQLQALQTRVAAMDAKPGEFGAAPSASPKLGAPPLPIPAPSASTTSPPTDQTSPTAPPPAAPLSSTTLADLGVLKSELAGIGGRVTAIETRLAALDPTGAGGAVMAGLQADIASLKAVIAGLQQQVAAAPSPAVTMSVVNLAEAAGRSGPFLTEFETLRSAMGNGPEVAALEAFARTGVPTRTILQERFSTLGPAIATAAASAQKDGGFVVWIRSLFSDMVKVTPAPDANGKGSDDVLLRAKTKLDQGDLSGCVDDLAALPNPPPQVTEWIAAARKRMALESRLSAVRAVASRPPTPAPVAVGAPTTPPVVAALNAITTPPAAPVPSLAPKTQGTNP
jgi:hypothetical protein